MASQLKNQSGMVIVLVILVITTILATALIFSGLIIRELIQSRFIDQSIRAYYLAESGSEKALYQSRRQEAVKPQDCPLVANNPLSACQDDSGYCSYTDNQVSCITNKSALSNFSGSWQASVDNEKDTVFNLEPGESFQIDLFSPYQSDQFKTNIVSFQVKSNLKDSTGLYAEMTNLDWLVGSNLNCQQPQSVPKPPVIVKGLITLNLPEDNYLVTGYLTSLPNGPSIDSNCSYILRLSSIVGESLAGQFTINIFDQANPDPVTNKLDIPSRLIINSQATYGNSFQQITVRTPMRSPVSGLYDFVIFSEAPIIK